MTACCAVLAVAFHLHAALAMTVLQQRTLLGYIDSGSSTAVNVDLGALLARLNATTTGTLKQRASAALQAYRTTVIAFGRDGELADVRAHACMLAFLGRPVDVVQTCWACTGAATRAGRQVHSTHPRRLSNLQGTGTSIFFPANADSMESSYASYVGTDAAALSAWLAFLQQLYSATSVMFASGEPTQRRVSQLCWLPANPSRQQAACALRTLNRHRDVCHH